MSSPAQHAGKQQQRSRSARRCRACQSLPQAAAHRSNWGSGPASCSTGKEAAVGRGAPASQALPRRPRHVRWDWQQREHAAQHSTAQHKLSGVSRERAQRSTARPWCHDAGKQPPWVSQRLQGLQCTVAPAGWEHACQGDEQGGARFRQQMDCAGCAKQAGGRESRRAAGGRAGTFAAGMAPVPPPPLKPLEDRSLQCQQHNKRENVRCRTTPKAGAAGNPNEGSSHGPRQTAPGAQRSRPGQPLRSGSWQAPV